MTRKIFTELDLVDDNKIINVGDPDDPQDVATKNYVDTVAVGGVGLGATYTAVTTARILDTRIDLGLAGVFTGGTPRKLQVTGVGGIPAGAVAVTGNLTVTQQTHAGFISLTNYSTASPATSTLNFPVGDNRANGVTSTLTADGEVWIVYMGEAGGATTHIILDVSGYFTESTEEIAFASRVSIVGEGVASVTEGDPAITTVTIPSWAPTTAPYLLTAAAVGLSSNAGVLVWNEVPGGTINSTNDTFTLVHAPLSSTTMMLFKNGILQRAGAGNDFTLATLTITFLAGNIPQTDDILACTYQW
jgi:hypothetical protein